MSNKILVAKTGINALTATNPNDFVFHSDYDTLKYETQGTVRLTVNQAQYWDFVPGDWMYPDLYYHYKYTTIAHNLDYIPYFAGYILNIPSSGEAIQAPYTYADFVSYARFNIYADTTKLYFMADFVTTSGSGNYIIDFAYRIFKNEIDL